MRQQSTLKINQSDLKLFGGAIILTVLICASIFFYTQWDLRRFKASLGDPPQVSTVSASEQAQPTDPLITEASSPETVVSKPSAAKARASGSQQTSPSVPVDPKAAITPPAPSVDAESEKETWNPLSEDIDWKRATQDDAYLRDVDNRFGHASVIDALQSNTSADPADVAFVSDMLRRSAEGKATIDDLIGMTEVWLRIQPDSSDETVGKTHHTLSNLYAHLQSAKERHSSGEILETRIYIGSPE